MRLTRANRRQLNIFTFETRTRLGKLIQYARRSLRRYKCHRKYEHMFRRTPRLLSTFFRRARSGRGREREKYFKIFSSLASLPLNIQIAEHHFFLLPPSTFIFIFRSPHASSVAFRSIFYDVVHSLEPVRDTNECTIFIYYIFYYFRRREINPCERQACLCRRSDQLFRRAITFTQLNFRATSESGLERAKSVLGMRRYFGAECWLRISRILFIVTQFAVCGSSRCSAMAAGKKHIFAANVYAALCPKFALRLEQTAATCDHSDVSLHNWPGVGMNTCICISISNEERK